MEDNHCQQLKRTFPALCSGFPELRSLKELHLCNMPELEIIDKGSLSGLMNLKELYVFNNMKLRSIHTDALASKDEKNEIWPPITKVTITPLRIFVRINVSQYWLLIKTTIKTTIKTEELS